MRFRKFQNTTGKPLQWYSYTIAVVYPSCFEIYENASQTGSQRNLRCMFSRLTEHTSAVTNKEVFIIFEFNGFIQRFPLHLQCCYTTLWSCEIRKSKNVTEFSLWNPVQAYSCQLPAAMQWHVRWQHFTATRVYTLHNEMNAVARKSSQP